MAVFVADEQTEVDIDPDHLSRLTNHVMASQHVPAGMEVSILCVDTETIRELNRVHMGADGPTDVLAFPLDAPGESPAELSILGDVVLCPAIAAGQADEHGRTTADEIDLLVVHGLLHLLGHDHAEAAEKSVMFDLTDRLLAEFAAGIEPVDAAVDGAHADHDGPSTDVGAHA